MIKARNWPFSASVPAGLAVIHNMLGLILAEAREYDSALEHYQ